MEREGNGQSTMILKKGKKKQAKDELDRLKQAEKKKRRLEKALATSAAIRSELEEKKQRKEEQRQRLDEEAAATAESVALHVLVGEDADDSRRFGHSNGTGNIGRFRGYQSWSSHGYESSHEWINWEIGWSWPCGEQPYRGGDISAGLDVARAVSSLQIAEDSLESQQCRRRTRSSRGF